MASTKYFYVLRDDNSVVTKYMRPEAYSHDERGFLHLEVTKNEYDDGIGSVPAQKIANARDAKKTKESDYDDWGKEFKAVIDVFIDEINAVRDHVGLPDVSQGQIKQAIKDKL